MVGQPRRRWSGSSLSCSPAPLPTSLFHGIACPLRLGPAAHEARLRGSDAAPRRRHRCLPTCSAKGDIYISTTTTRFSSTPHLHLPPTMYIYAKEYLNWYGTRRDANYRLKNPEAPVIGLVLQRSLQPCCNLSYHSGILHTIFFHRTLTLVRLKDVDCDLFEITYEVDEKINQFIACAEKNPNRKSQIINYANEKKDHIPPISDRIFNHEILVPISSNSLFGWNADVLRSALSSGHSYSLN
ncbi:hypothetical protein ZWY2020_037435 [Hordeum vulgare]|nr:hypothetical protein ZWY2020_037435 [Hordeum vulgare]